MHPPLEQSSALARAPGIHHGFLGRRGGVSEGEFASLNASRYVGDDFGNVADNVHRAVMALKAGPVPVALVKQVHGTAVHTVTGRMDLDNRPEADAMVSAVSGIALGILSADCAPLLLADPEAGVIGAAHAGWRGAVAGVLENTVAAMEALGAVRRHILLAIGPAISAAHYEVGPDFAETLRTRYPEAADFLVCRPGSERPQFDLIGLVRHQGQTRGLKAIETVGGCTYGHPDLYFSHRHATHNDTRAGRQIALIVKE